MKFIQNLLSLFCGELLFFVHVEVLLYLLGRHGLSVEVALCVVTACHPEYGLLHVVLDALCDSLYLLGLGYAYYRRYYLIGNVVVLYVGDERAVQLQQGDGEYLEIAQ